MRIRGVIFAAAAVALTLVGVSAAGKDNAARRAQKARYYYTEGLKAMAEGKGPEAYEYLAKAYAIDPGNADAAYDYGSLRIHLPFDSVSADTELLRSFSMMTPYVKAYPGDASKAQFYAYKAIELDSVPEALATYKALLKARPGDTDNLPLLADTYMRMEQPDSALATLGRYERIEGFTPAVTVRKFSYQIVKGDTAAALGEADALIASNPRLPAYHVLKGQLHGYVNRPDSALAAYKYAESLDPQDGATQYALALYYQQQGDSAEYDTRIYNTLMAERMEVDTKMTILGEYLSKFTKDDSSKERGDALFRVLTEQYPHEASILYYSASWKALKKDWEGAVEDIRYAIDLDPSNSDYRHMLISCLIAAEKPEQAMKEYTKAIEIGGEDPELATLYAAAALELDDIEAVKKTFGKLIHDLVPEFPLEGRISDKSAARNLDFYSLYALSNYYQMYGDGLYQHFQKHPENKDLLEQTYDAYENALSIISDNPLTLNNYAYFLCENGGDLEKAKEMSSRAITYSQTATNLDTYAWILFRMGDYKEARTYQEAAMEKAKEEGTESAELYGHYGDILFMNGEPEKALENWKKALEMEPEDELLRKKVEHRTFFYE